MSKFTTLSVAVIGALALSACQDNSAQSEAGVSSSSGTEGGATVVKIGFAAPLTGPQAHYGEEYKNGVVLAIEEANTEKQTINGQPVTFELVAEDDQADPKIATQVAQKFVDQQVNGVIGHFNSGCSIPASRIYSEAGIPQISTSTSPALTAQGFQTVFRSMTSDSQQGSVMGQFAVVKLGAKKIAIVDDRTSYGQGLADEFEKAVRSAGVTAVKREFTNDKATDFSAILTSIKGESPDLLFFGGADAQSGPMSKQMKRLGLNIPLISGDMTMSPTFLMLAGKEGDGAIASLPGLPLSEMPKGKEYEARYRNRFKTDVETYSPYSYDSTRMLIAAMAKAGSSEPAKYLPILAKMQHQGVTGTFEFDDKGDQKNGSITVYKVINKQWTVMETVKSNVKAVE